jgi:hypothetical protein
VGSVGVVGAFSKTDVAFGLTRVSGQSGVLVKFAGDAVPGTSAPLSEATYIMASGEAKNFAIAQDTLAFGKQTIEQTGGQLRFSLQGFDVEQALTPRSTMYNSVTSIEFRGILSDTLLMNKTNFYRNGVDVTEEILRGHK